MLLLENNTLIPETKQTFYVEVGTKKYPMSITQTTYVDATDGRIVYIECEGAGLSQEYVESDLPLLFQDIAGMIESEQSKKANDRINFRISSDDKLKIDKNARKYGFKTTSDFLKTLGTDPEKVLQVR